MNRQIKMTVGVFKLSVGALFFLLFTPSVFAQTPLEKNPEYWQTFVESPGSTFEWRVDRDTQKLNFRRCDAKQELDGKLACRDPMMKVGLEPADLPFLLNFYLERLMTMRDNNQKWMYGISVGGLAGLGGYIGLLGNLRLAAESLPEKMGSIVRRSYHVLVAGGVLVAAYYIYTLAKGHNDQLEVLDELEKAVVRHPRLPPKFYVHSQTVFDEFMQTFQTTILAFLNKETEAGAYYILQ